jgi:hypothetical protein
MNIFKITIATIILSQSAFASYGKAIVGGAVAGATAGYVMGAGQSHNNQTYSNTNAYRCWCGTSVIHTSYADYPTKTTLIHCKVLKNVNGKKELKRNDLLRFNPENAPEIIFGKLQQTNNLIGCEKI